MGDFINLVWAFPVGIVVSLYTTFIIQKFWNWFAVPAFNLPEISFWVIYGLVLLISLLAEGQKTEKFSEDQRWNNMSHILDACVPQEKREEVMELIKVENKEIWVKIGIGVFSKFVGNTFVFLIGWAVHTFLV